MNDFLKFIEDKVKKNIEIQSIIVIDNSNQHKKHKFFDKTKYHLRLEIYSTHLNSLNKIAAQREIMNLFVEELKHKIHALEIKIK